MIKQYVGISRDHSGSMASLSNAAMRDYNANIATIKTAAVDNDIDTIVSVVRCGVRGGVDQEAVNSSVQMLKPLKDYVAGGGTPLFDSVGELIDILSKAPDVNKPGVSFLVMAITDGEENQSRNWTGTRLGNMIRDLQRTDKWTFVFRVPRGYARRLAELGIPSGNIQEWEQTEKALEHTTRITTQAINRYYTGLRSGMTSTDHFYANAASVTPTQAKRTLPNITRDVISNIVPVTAPSKGVEIKSFMEDRIGYYHPGTAFFQLTKTEKAIQSYKLIVIRDKNNGTYYGGRDARTLLGLPQQGTIKLSPGDHGDWDIFIQSTSNNRLLQRGTEVLYWPKAS